MKNAGFKRRVRMDDEGLERPKRRAPVPEDYDDDDFGDDYCDNNQEEVPPSILDNENPG
jgi:hypothetical protein